VIRHGTIASAVTEESLYKGIGNAKPDNEYRTSRIRVQSHVEAKRVFRLCVPLSAMHRPRVASRTPKSRILEDQVTVRLQPGMTLAIEPMVNEGGHRIVT